MLANQNLKYVVFNIWCLLCALAGTHMVARWGRKPTAIFSQGTLTVCLFIIGGLAKMYASNPNGASNSLIYGNVAVIFLFQGFFSIGWTPLLTVYSPEILNYAIRANGVALSTVVASALG
jgi:MFS family permease